MILILSCLVVTIDFRDTNCLATLTKFLEGAWILNLLPNMHVGMDSKANFQVPSQSEIMGQPNERPNEDELPHELPKIDLRIRRGV